MDTAQSVLVVRAGIAQANGEMWETDTNCTNAVTSPSTR